MSKTIDISGKDDLSSRVSADENVPKDRPYVFCHMEMSLDGKIMGKYMRTAEGKDAGDVFDEIAFGKNPFYKHKGWLSGRVTTDDNFTFYEKPELEQDTPIVPEGDFVNRPNEDMYYVSIDTSGKLGWKSSTIKYMDTTAHVIEVLTEKATNPYRSFLRKLGISYMIVGKEELDSDLMLKKLKNDYQIETLMLGGGGILNWSLIQKGLCDELSIVIAAAADGSNETPALFSVREGLSTDDPIGFDLIEAKKMSGGSVWLRYKVKNLEN